MRHMRKLVALFAALALVLAMAVPAFAATVRVDSNAPNHTYKAYQIFTGTQKQGEKELGNPQWGDGINVDEFVAALKTAGYVDSTVDASNAQAVVEALGKIASDSADANAIAKIAFAHKQGDGVTLSDSTDLKSGYYLIVDSSEVTGEYDAKNAALLQVTGGDMVIKNKTDKPSVEKKVQENTKYNADEGYGAGYNDVADYNIGDEVPFRLIGTIPDMSQYTKYEYTFVDTYSAGLNAPQNIVVTLSNTKEPSAKVLVEGTDYTINQSAGTFSINIADLKAVVDSDNYKYVVVSYTSVLNTSAVIGLDGNPNEVHLIYSNNPNGTGTGKTPDDKVIVFTYELDTTKVDASNNAALANVEFKLKNAAGKYVQVDANNKVIGWTADANAASTLTSDENGLFKVIGLDAGKYTLEETKELPGYNSIDPVEFEIIATTANGQNWTSGADKALTDLEIKVGASTADGNTSTGIVDMTIKNSKGAVLPSTGGIGTTIFYVVGGGLMVAAAVLLITKKRMENK